MMVRVQDNGFVMLVLMACGLLGACSHSGSNSGAPLIKRHDAGTPNANSAGKAADAGPTDLVSAVSGNGGADGAVGLKFELGQRPVAGQPLLLTLRLVANQPLEHLEARFHADEGLQVTEGSDFESPGHMDAGDSVDHALTVLPDRDGVYSVMATVTTGSATEGVSRSFVIPIVVAAAAPGSAPAAKSPTPPNSEIAPSSAVSPKPQ
jgi:hypothetical protein